MNAFQNTLYIFYNLITLDKILSLAPIFEREESVFSFTRHAEIQTCVFNETQRWTQIVPLKF